MNGSDMSDTLKLGLTVLILCFLVGIVFQLFTMARSVTSQSSNRLQSSINQMSDMAYASYDNQTVFGSTVVSAVSQFSADKMTVVVDNNTGSFGDVTTERPSASTHTISGGKAAYYGYGIEGNKLTFQNTYYSATLNTDAADKSTDTSPLKLTGDANVYVNEALRYNALLIRDDTDEIVGVYFKLIAN